MTNPTIQRKVWKGGILALLAIAPVPVLYFVQVRQTVLSFDSCFLSDVLTLETLAPLYRRLGVLGPKRWWTAPQYSDLPSRFARPSNLHHLGRATPVQERRGSNGPTRCWRRGSLCRVRDVHEALRLLYSFVRSSSQGEGTVLARLARPDQKSLDTDYCPFRSPRKTNYTTLRTQQSVA
jgi:hypothetical protein